VVCVKRKTGVSEVERKWFVVKINCETASKAGLSKCLPGIEDKDKDPGYGYGLVFELDVADLWKLEGW
jgi:hypothetical protein